MTVFYTHTESVSAPRVPGLIPLRSHGLKNCNSCRAEQLDENQTVQPSIRHTAAVLLLTCRHTHTTINGSASQRRLDFKRGEIHFQKKMTQKVMQKKVMKPPLRVKHHFWVNYPFKVTPLVGVAVLTWEFEPLGHLPQVAPAGFRCLGVRLRLLRLLLLLC